MNKAYFRVGIIKRFRDILPCDSLVTIYKSFIGPHLDCRDVIYDQPNYDSFSDKIEQLQYKARLAITGAIQGTSQECLSNEFGLESLSSRRWCRKLYANYKFLSTQSPKYLFDIIPSSFMIHARNRDLFSIIAELSISNILSFQIIYLNGRNLRLKYKTRSLLYFSKANFSLL